QFVLGGIHTSASGKIMVTTAPTSTTIELNITGLASNSSHISHVHSGSCQQPGGILFALNQVLADVTGAADARTTIQAKYRLAGERRARVPLCNGALRARRLLVDQARPFRVGAA